MTRLSRAQLDALEELDDFARAGLTATEALVRVGPRFRQTLGALVRRGHARYFPYGGDGQGAWRITDAGRQTLDAQEEPR